MASLWLNFLLNTTVAGGMLCGSLAAGWADGWRMSKLQ